MRIKNKSAVVNVNTLSNWPLIADLFVKWGYHEPLLEEAKDNQGITLNVHDMDTVTSELCAWGIPWKRVE